MKKGAQGFNGSPMEGAAMEGAASLHYVYSIIEEREQRRERERDDTKERPRAICSGRHL